MTRLSSFGACATCLTPGRTSSSPRRACPSKGLTEAGLTDTLYGVPALPGTMTLIGRIGGAQIIGVPACALFFKTTVFDIILPRMLAGVPIPRLDLAKIGNGGLCMECKVCTFPKCPFGKV